MPRDTSGTPKPVAGAGRPSALALLPVLGAAWLAVAVARMPILTPDVWWHLATGRIIATSGIPHTDPFSYTLGATPWTVHEWLADRFLYATHVWGGLLGVVTLRAVLLVCAAAVSYRLARLHAGSAAALACVTLAAYASQRNWLDRPQLWSYVLLPLVLLVLERARGVPSRLVWILPLVFAAWVNLHGGFMLGLVLVLAWAGAGAFAARHAAAGARRAARRDVWVALACAVATLANPHGFGGALYPLHYVGVGLAETIREERPGRLDSPYAWAHLALAVVLLGTLLRRWRGVPLAHRVTGLALVAVSWPRIGGVALPFAAERHAPLFLFAATPLVAWQLDALRGVRGRAAAARLDRAFATLPAWSAALLVAAFVAWQAARAWPRDPSPAARLLPGRFPTAAAAWIDAQRLPERLLNPYRWGGYLAWTLAPRHKVWIDSRGDLYGAARLRDDEILYRLPPGSGPAAAALLERDRPDVIVYPLLTLDFGPLQMHPFTRWLLGRDDWRLVYWDRADPAHPHAPAATTAVFLRVAPRNAAWLERLPPVTLPSGLPH